jgi:peptide deformylase
LLRPTAEVETVDDEIRRLVRDMIDTMYAAPGIGLAANQVGVALRICIVDITAGEQPESLVTFINPVVTDVAGSQIGEEGCLSFPDITLEVERNYTATVEALDPDGKPFTYSCEGLMARATLHEIEHLAGQTFLRNVSAIKRELVKRQIRKRIKFGDWVAEAAQ